MIINLLLLSGIQFGIESHEHAMNKMIILEKFIYDIMVISQKVDIYIIILIFDYICYKLQGLDHI